MSIEPVSGFPEWLPAERLVEERFIDTIRQQYQRFGFTPIETPAVERLEVLTAKGGLQRQIFTLGRPQEGAAEAELGLHFDLTVPLARYVVQHAHELVFPFRRYQIQKVWRGERAQRGRFREFYQCDIDIVGRSSLEPIHDAEIPCVINATFTALGLPDFTVFVSNRKILRDLLAAGGQGGNANAPQQSAEQLAGALRAIDKTDRDGLDETRKALLEEGVPRGLVPVVMDLVQCPGIAEAEKVFAAAGIASEGLAELRTVVDSAVALGMPAERLRPNFRIARGLDYYTGTVYETLVAGRENWGSVCSGGRYDDLASFFSTQRFPGVGISIGLSRLLAVMIAAGLVDVSRKSPTQVLVAAQDRKNYLMEYLGFAKELREAGIPAEVYFEPHGLRDQIGYAASNGIPLAVIAGESEFKEGSVTIRDLRTRKQEKAPRGELVERVRQKLAKEA
jgi:histidyl-tRNA synthetase